jgi:hypothetical protein
MRRAKLAPPVPGHVVGGPVSGPLPSLADIRLPAEEVDELEEARAVKEPFRFQFSLRQLIIAMTIAAVVLGAMHFLGGPAATATVLGLIALVGLFVFALGYEPPSILVFGWWFTLVLYVAVSLFAAVFGGFR